MTIIETLCNIARNNALTFTEEEQDAMAEAILSVRELQWYREQDLIRREDVIPIPIYCTHGMGECSVTYTCPKCWEETIMQIQKVEYGGDK